MIHPSYVELMNVVNKTGNTGEAPVVNSRYSIVAATAKRARQIIDGSDPMVDNPDGQKPLSLAIEELYEGSLKILTGEEAAQMDIELIEFRQRESQRLAMEASMAKAALEEAKDEGNEEE